MGIFWKVTIALIIGNSFGGLMVFATKVQMRYYKDEYSDFWTKKKYIILYSIVTVVTVIVFIGYFESSSNL